MRKRAALESGLSSWRVADRQTAIDLLTSVSRQESHRLIRERLDRERNPLLLVDLLELAGELRVSSARRRIVTLAETHPSVLVRGNAIDAISRMPLQATDSWLKRRSRSERNHWVRASIDAALARLGDKEALASLIARAGDEDYHVRCAVAHRLHGLVTQRNARQFLEVARKWLFREESAAVRSSVRSLLEECKRVASV